jgi:hypothetical protein
MFQASKREYGTGTETITVVRYRVEPLEDTVEITIVLEK